METRSDRDFWSTRFAFKQRLRTHWEHASLHCDVPSLQERPDRTREVDDEELRASDKLLFTNTLDDIVNK